MDEWAARERADLIERIDRHGYTAIVVGTGACSVPGCDCRPEPYPYAYSLGFCEDDHAELVVFGLPLDAVGVVMDPIHAAVRRGRPVAVGDEHRHDLGNGPIVSLVPVPELWARRDPGRIGGWVDLFGPPLPAMVQVCWADRHGCLPWESGCDPDVAARQPILADDPLRYPRPPRDRSRHRRRSGRRR